MEIFANDYVFSGFLILVALVSLGVTLSTSFVTERFSSIWASLYSIILLASIYLTETFDSMIIALRNEEFVFAYSFAVGASIGIIIMSYLATLLLTIFLRIHKAIDKED